MNCRWSTFEASITCSRCIASVLSQRHMHPCSCWAQTPFGQHTHTLHSKDCWSKASTLIVEVAPSNTIVRARTKRPSPTVLLMNFRTKKALPFFCRCKRCTAPHAKQHPDADRASTSVAKAYEKTKTAFCSVEIISDSYIRAPKTVTCDGICESEEGQVVSASNSRLSLPFAPSSVRLHPSSLQGRALHDSSSASTQQPLE